jgi:hypothetical protein
VGLAPKVVDRGSGGSPATGELAAEAALADPGLAHDPDDLLSVGEGLLELGQLVLTADQARGSVFGCHVQAPAPRARAQEFGDPQRPADPVDREPPKVTESDVSVHQGGGVLADVHLPGLGQLLHALGQAHGVPDGRVLHVQVVADRSHHHLAGVQPDAHGEAEPVCAPHLGGEVGDVQL